MKQENCFPKMVFLFVALHYLDLIGFDSAKPYRSMSKLFCKYFVYIKPDLKLIYAKQNTISQAVVIIHCKS